jgi:hypothetical protein
VTIKSVSALQKAVTRLQAKGVGCDLITNAKPRVHGYDAAPTCEYVLKLKNGAYDVGFKKQADGTFEPVLDTYQNHVGKQIGASCPMPNTAAGKTQHQMGQFLQLYGEEAAKEQAMSQGYMVESTNTDEAGNVHLVLTGM